MNRFARVVARRLLLSACLAVSPAAMAQAGDLLRTVALSGQPAPGLGTANRFGQTLRAPVLNDLGEVAFEASYTSDATGPVVPVGIWSEAGGAPLRLVDDINNCRNCRVERLLINNVGTTVF